MGNLREQISDLDGFLEGPLPGPARRGPDGRPASQDPDAGFRDIVQEFEAVFTELESQDAALPAGKAESRPGFTGDIDEVLTASRVAEPRPRARDARREPTLAQSPARPAAVAQPQPVAPSSAATFATPAASRAGVTVLAVGVALAVGVGVGFTAAKLTQAANVAPTIATSAAGGAVLRLDYELKPAAGAARRR